MVLVDPNSVSYRANHFLAPSLPATPTPTTPWTKKIVQVLIATVIFPIGILWIIKKICLLFFLILLKPLLGLLGGLPSLVLPASVQYTKNPKRYLDMLEDGSNYQSIKNPANQVLAIDNGKKFEPLTLKTADGINLSACIAWGNGAKTDRFKKDSKWIISFNPNTACYEQWIVNNSEAAKKYFDNNINVLCFNYRGVMDSDGQFNTAQDLVTDGYAALQFLLQQGIPAKQIVLVGTSLGGGVSAQVAALVPDVNIANVSSFSSIEKLLECSSGGHSASTNKKRSKGIKRFFTSISAKIYSACASEILNYSRLEFDTLKVWPKIRGRKWIITCTHDEIMIDGGTLAKALKRQQPGYKKVWNKKDPANAIQLVINQKIKNDLLLIKSRNATHCEVSDDALLKHMDNLKTAFS